MPKVSIRIQDMPEYSLLISGLYNYQAGQRRSGCGQAVQEDVMRWPMGSRMLWDDLWVQGRYEKSYGFKTSLAVLLVSADPKLSTPLINKYSPTLEKMLPIPKQWKIKNKILPQPSFKEGKTRIARGIPPIHSLLRHCLGYEQCPQDPDTNVQRLVDALVQLLWNFMIGCSHRNPELSFNTNLSIRSHLHRDSADAHEPPTPPSQPPSPLCTLVYIGNRKISWHLNLPL